jgi:hypothetical protein
MSFLFQKMLKKKDILQKSFCKNLFLSVIKCVHSDKNPLLMKNYFGQKTNCWFIVNFAVKQNLIFVLFSATVGQKYVKFGSKYTKNSLFVSHFKNLNYGPIS